MTISIHQCAITQAEFIRGMAVTVEGRVLPLSSWFSVKTPCSLLTSALYLHPGPHIPGFSPFAPAVPPPLFQRQLTSEDLKQGRQESNNLTVRAVYGDSHWAG